MPRSKGTNTSRGERRAPPRGPMLVLVGGKGGVGKTSCAAALAVRWARQGHRTLLITTDPAPSLADALRVPLGGAPRRIGPARLPLHAVELDATKAFRRWMAARRAVLERVATRGTLLDLDDVRRLLDLSLPGIDEVAGLLEIAAFVHGGRYARIVVDTAPTGHTLRLLAMPDTLARVAAVFDAMQDRHRAVVAALRGGWAPDEGDRLVQDLADTAAGMDALLRDPERTVAWWVTLPETLAVSETTDGLAALGAFGITVGPVVVNRVTPLAPGPCTRCEARRRYEAASVRRLARAVPGASLRFVHARPREPRGISALASLGRELEGPRPPLAQSGGGRWQARSGAGSRVEAASIVSPTVRLVLYGGKGGVGKTTCATAAALSLAARRRVLLVSTDPAHSLGDVLRAEVDDSPRPVRGTRGRLQVREIDAAARFTAIRERYRAVVDALFERLAGGSAIDAGHDRRIISSLLDLAPPGLDELVAIADVAALLESPGGADVIVLDLAPSGHALRLLETPALVLDWVRALMAILLKYRALVGLGDLATLLLDLSRSLARLRARLADAEGCAFVAVTRAAALPRLETARTLRQLGRMRVPLGALVVNAVGRGGCRRCRLEAAAEAQVLRAFHRMTTDAGVPLVAAPEAAPPPTGPAGLRVWSRVWRVYDRS